MKIRFIIVCIFLAVINRCAHAGIVEDLMKENISGFGMFRTEEGQTYQACRVIKDGKVYVMVVEGKEVIFVYRSKLAADVLNIEMKDMELIYAAPSKGGV